MRMFGRVSLSLGHLARGVGLVGVLGLLAACGADGEPETPTRDAVTPSALAAR